MYLIVGLLRKKRLYVSRKRRRFTLYDSLSLFVHFVERTVCLSKPTAKLFFSFVHLFEIDDCMEPLIPPQRLRARNKKKMKRQMGRGEGERMEKREQNESKKTLQLERATSVSITEIIVVHPWFFQRRNVYATRGNVVSMPSNFSTVFTMKIPVKSETFS